MSVRCHVVSLTKKATGWLVFTGLFGICLLESCLKLKCYTTLGRKQINAIKMYH